MRRLLALLLIFAMLVLSSCELVIGTNGIYINKGETTTTTTTTTPPTTTTTTTNDGGDDNPSEDYTYIDFTPTEKKLYMDLIGEVIPFIPNNEYYVEEYSVPFEYMTIKAITFITYGNTQEEFDAYRELFSNYSCSTYTNDLGILCYVYESEDASYSIEMSYGEYDGQYMIMAGVLCQVKGGTNTGTGIPYDELFTNEGAGLPSDPDGVYDLDFAKGEYIKDVTNQGEYANGCPPTGSPAVLVIPVQFSDITAESKGYTTDVLVEVLSKGGKTDYYSLYDYYYISSYGQLTLDITVLDFWFTPEHESEYYSQFTFTYEDQELPQGEQLILDEALDYLDDFMDLSQFDSDNNGTIDSVVLVNTLEIDPTISYYWAFRYFNFYRDEDGSYYEYDNVHAKDYIWMPYQFIFEGDDENGNHIYNDTSAMNTNTFIHEFGHILGLEDYYDYASINTPLIYDIMYHGLGDHNAYSKFNLGWITTSRLVVTDSTITLTLEDFSKNGDTIIIANNWDDKLGAYQEYYVLVYYTNNGLNAGKGNGYFADEGVLVYHVNAAMYMQEGKDLYDVYNKNTDVTHEYGTLNNLIDYVLNADGEHVYGVGDTMPTVIDDYGNELIYTFVIDEITSEYATITFTVK